MSRTVHLPMLDQIRIASPCNASWADMAGDDRVRHCAQCDLDVHNLSAMSREDAEDVLRGLASGRVCVRFYQRADGTILTRDCPIGVAALRRKLLKATSRLAAAIGLIVFASAMARAAENKSWANWGWSMRLSNVAPLDGLLARVRAWWTPPAPPGFWVTGDFITPVPKTPAPDASHSG